MINTKAITCLSEQGKRENIEDAVYPPYRGAKLIDRLFLVCDGVGGESKGEEASRIATEGFSDYFNNNPFSDKDNTSGYLQQAQLHTIGRMQQYIAHHPEAAKMSTTLTLAYILEDRILAAWCGDSRIYHFREGNVLWRSTDHSMVSMLVRRGEISEKEAESHPQKNIILRSISANGSPADIDMHWLTDIKTDDNILLCTDGVLEQMDESKFKSVLLSEDRDKRRLFLKYCEGVTNDNYSFYLIKLKTDNQAVPGVKKTNKILIIVIGILILLMISIASFFFINLKNDQNKKIPEKNINQEKPRSKHKESDEVIPQ